MQSQTQAADVEDLRPVFSSLFNPTINWDTSFQANELIQLYNINIDTHFRT